LAVSATVALASLRVSSATLAQDADAAAPSPFVDVEVAGERGCGLRRDGTVACWEGRGDAGEVEAGRVEAVRVEGIDDATSIAIVLDQPCARRRDGEVLCIVEGRRHVPTALQGASSIVAAGTLLCATLPTEVRCTEPFREGGTEQRFADAVAVGYESNGGLWCRVQRGGEVRCTGALAWLGGARFARATAVTVASMQACVLEGGRVRCFRVDDDGVGTVLGDGGPSRGGRGIARVRGPRSAEQIASDVRGLAVCAREADGAVWCWGGQPAYWGDDQLVRGAPLDVARSPTRVPGLDAVDIAIGNRSLCAVTRAGVVVCTGPEQPSEPRSPPRRWTVR
jgi:hypothetical protein